VKLMVMSPEVTTNMRYDGMIQLDDPGGGSVEDVRRIAIANGVETELIIPRWCR
jgi:hypothetical protein